MSAGRGAEVNGVVIKAVGNRFYGIGSEKRLQIRAGSGFFAASCPMQITNVRR